MLPTIDATRSLARYNQDRLQPGCLLDACCWEIAYIESLRQEVKDNIPLMAGIGWYLDLLRCGPGQGDSLFPWLAEEATRSQMMWFLRQEAAGEAGFDDLVALAQIKMPAGPKLEMARNYWDEMGQGEEQGMHGRLLEDVLHYFSVQPASIEEAMPESLLLSNLMMGLACHRRYAYLAIGALGVIEMTAPSRVKYVTQGLERLGVPKSARQYFTLHATLDLKHSRDWNNDVIRPLAADPRRLAEIVEGAYLRLWVGEKCIRRYRAELMEPARC